VSESTDSAQASIVFLGRESFRMQVVADGVPQRLMDMPTERIVDRRQASERRKANERRKPRFALEAPVEAPVDPWPTPAPAWNRVVAVSLATFVFGVLLTMTVDRFTRHARAKVIASSPVVSAVTPPVAPPAAPQPAPPPAVVVQPLPQPAAEPAPLPAAAPQSPIDLHPRKLRAVAKAPAARPRRAAAATSAVGSHAAAIATPGPRKKWVDPFAE